MAFCKFIMNRNQPARADMTVITRFAPSPTGFLHIGGARTALFNLLFAKRHGGKFLLRIEDTDRKRSTPEAVAAILEGMEWLGLTPDDPPVYQAERAGRHVEIAEAMVANGTAFRCYVTQEELQERREAGNAKRAAAKADGLGDEERAILRAEADALLAAFRSPYRDGAGKPNDDTPYTVRLRAPDEGEMVIEDAVQGRVTIQSSEIDDLIMLRADGTPTYMLAVVVDDHDMGITHIIRGDDHLRNAFRQTPIYKAMGWNVPEFAHLPLIHGPDGAKLSKRHGALGAEAYRDLGYLPEALNNYLLRLGWSDGDQELFTLDQAAKAFSLEAIGKSPARLDFDKMADINAHYIRECEPGRLLSLVLEQLQKETNLSPNQCARVEIALPHMKDRGSTIVELAEAFAFLLSERPLTLNKKARKALRGEGLDRLALLGDFMAKLDAWTPETLENALGEVCDKHGLSIGQVGPPLRAALTAGLPAPDLNQVAAWLGREETLARIQDQITAARDADT